MKTVLRSFGYLAKVRFIRNVVLALCFLAFCALLLYILINSPA